MLRVFLLMAGMLWSSAVLADGWNIGWLVTESQFKLSDHDGPSAAKAEFGLMNFVLAAPRERDDRFLAQLSLDRFDTAASTTGIGASVKRLDASLSYQTRLRASRYWKPWVGIGLGFANETQRSRYTVRSDGFLARSYPEINQNGLVAVVNATSEWAIAEQWTLGVHLQYEEPLGHTARGLRAGLIVLFELR